MASKEMAEPLEGERASTKTASLSPASPVVTDESSPATSTKRESRKSATVSTTPDSLQTPLSGEQGAGPEATTPSTSTKKRRSSVRSKKPRESSSKGETSPETMSSPRRTSKTSSKEKVASVHEDSDPTVASAPSTTPSEKRKRSEKRFSPESGPSGAKDASTETKTENGGSRKNRKSGSSPASPPPTLPLDSITTMPVPSNAKMASSLASLQPAKPKLPGSRNLPTSGLQPSSAQPVFTSPVANSASSKPPLHALAASKPALPSTVSMPVIASGRASAPSGPTPIASAKPALPHMQSVSKGPAPAVLGAPGSRIHASPVTAQNSSNGAKPTLPGSRALLPASAAPPSNPVSLTSSSESLPSPRLSVRSGSGQDYVDYHNETVPKGLPPSSLLSASDAPVALKMPDGPTPVIGKPAKGPSSPQIMLPGSASIIAPPPVPSPAVAVPAISSDSAPPTATTLPGSANGSNGGGQQISFANRGYTEFPKRILDTHGFVAIVGGGNELSELPLGLASRTSITRLEFPSNQFKELPLVVTELPNLVYLDFSKNKIALLAPAISSMKSLKHLSLAHNRLRAFPNHLGSLSGLERLDLSGNKLKTLPPRIGQLNRISELRLGGCDIDALPPEIGQLVLLETLYMPHNGLNKVPTEFGALLKLKELDFSNNLFTTTPTALFYASGLVDINLEQNEIIAVAEDIVRLGSLTRLNLANNKLLTLPCELAYLTQLTQLNFTGNSLSSIPIESQADTTSMLEYLTRLKLQSAWKRRKLVFVGEEFVGKTSLRMQLLNSYATKASKRKRKHRGIELQTPGNVSSSGGSGMPNSSSSSSSADHHHSELADPVATDGIDIEDWEPLGTDEDGLEPITFSTWDFAGQQIYHPTHQFFITNRSMYLIIFNLLDERTSRVEYWLKTLRVRTDGRCPVVVVGTHVDDRKCDTKYIETIFSSMKKKYSSRFPFVREYLAVSSKTGKGLGKLTETLVALARSNASFRSVPDSYTKVEKTIMQIRTQNSTLSFNDFAQVASSAGVEKEDCITCLEFFHDVGLVIYYNDKIAGLSDMVILDPLWIVNLLSSVITLKHSYVKGGIMMASCLPQIWKEYPASEYNWLLKLLDKFEITFRIVASATTGDTTHEIRTRWIRTLVQDMNATPMANTLSSSPSASSSNPLQPSPLLLSGASTSALSTTPAEIPKLALTQPVSASTAEANKRASLTLEAARMPLQDMIVIPSMLPATPAELHFNELWKDHRLFEPHVSGRRYIFQFLPLGFFSRLLVRTLHMSGLVPQYVWRDGMIIDSDSERAILLHNELDYLLDIVVRTKRSSPSSERKLNEKRRSTIDNGSFSSPRTPGQARKGLTAAFTLLRQLSDCIETLLVSWFKLKVIVQVPCHHCLQEKLYDDPDWQPYYFPIEECMLAVREGKDSVTCHADRKAFMSKKKLFSGSVRGSVKSSVSDRHSNSAASGDSIFNLWASSTATLGKDHGRDPPPSPTSSSSAAHGASSSGTNLPGESPSLTRALSGVPTSPHPGASGSHATGLNASNNNASGSNNHVGSGGASSSAAGAEPSTDENGEHFCLLKDLCPDIAFSDVSDMTVNYEDLHVGDVIGEGSYAELRTGMYNGEKVAVKVLKHQSAEGGGLSQQMDLLSDSFRELQHETFVMKNLKHPYLVELKAICTHPLAMVMDYFPLGSLDRHLRDTTVKHPCLSWKYRVRLALNIAQGMDYLHSEDFMHRDLRSPNILIASRDENEEIVAKVADFGLAVICAKEFKGGDFNECWTAPEILKAAAYNSKVDVYSFAIVMWELLEMGHPFKEYEAQYASLPRLDFFDAIIKGLRPSFPLNCPEPYINLVTACWATEPEDRPPFDRIAEVLSDMLPLASRWDDGDLTASAENSRSLRMPTGSTSLRNLLRKKSKESNLLLRMQRQGQSAPDVFRN